MQLIRILINFLKVRIIVLTVTHPLAVTAKLKKPESTAYAAAFDFVIKKDNHFTYENIK